jgi:hypothetical protein
MLACRWYRKQLSQPRQHYKQNCESPESNRTPMNLEFAN